MKTFKKFVSVFSIALLGGICALSLNHFYVQKQNQFFAEANVRNPLPVKFTGFNPMATTEGSVNFVDAAKKSVPAVVHIKSKVEMQDTRYNNLWDYFYGNQRQQPMEGMVSGSGVVVSSDGYIVTNNHVIDQAGKIEVTMSDRQTFTAKIIGRDPETDLALLKVDATNLPFMEYGNSDNVEVGQWVLAVGNPYNLTSTVTAGIISAKGRNIDILPNDPSRDLYPIESYLQTDAAVNPGNSGGALVNTEGQLVGINSAIASTTGSYTGYSFAIPVNLVRKVVADMLQYGRAQRAFLGVTIRTVDADIAKEKGLDGTEGVYIDALTANGAAEAAGLKEGDVILKVGDQSVNDVASLEEQIARYRPGDKVNVTVNRDNKQVSIDVTLRNLEGTTSMAKPHSEGSPSNSEAVAINELGASFGTVTEDEKTQLNIDNGVKVVNLEEGKLRNIGVHKGFIITKIDHQPVASVDDIEKIINNKTGGILVEGIYPNGTRAYYAFGA
ncbi:MAG TPA: Do family serine endopeptidase [Bacteroidia bacterium]|nr:Do family serine endopeptidase [Bacteroidia bacterium]